MRKKSILLIMSMMMILLLPIQALANDDEYATVKLEVAEEQKSWEECLLQSFGFSAGTNYFAKGEKPEPDVIYQFMKMKLDAYLNDEWCYELTYPQYMEEVAKYFENYCEMKEYLLKLGEYDETNDKVLIYSGGAGGGEDWILTSKYHVSKNAYVLQGIYVSTYYTSGVPYSEEEYIVHPVELTLSSNVDGEWKIISYEMSTYYCKDDELLGATIFTYDENGMSTGKSFYRITTMYSHVGDEELMPIDLSDTYSFKYDEPYEHWYLSTTKKEDKCSWSVKTKDGYTVRMQIWTQNDGNKISYQDGKSGTFDGKGAVMLVPSLRAVFTLDANHTKVSVVQGLTNIGNETYAYNQGDKVELKIAADKGYRISSVMVGDAKANYVSASGTYVAYPSFAPGKIKVNTAKNCDAGHSWDSGKVTQAATCTATGVKTYTCKICSKTKTETLAKQEHDYGSYKVIKKATFAEDGSKKASCKVCGTEKSVKILKATASLDTTKYHYTDSKKSPSVVVKNSNGDKLTKGTHYTYKYNDTERMSIGTHSVKVTLSGTQYSGSKTLYFYILPKGPASAWADLYEYNKAKVSWEQSYKAAGYKVYYKLADTKEEYQYLGSTTKTYYKTSSLTAGKEYTFKIIPYIIGESGNVSWAKTVVNTNLKTHATCNVKTLKKVSTPKVTKVNATKVKVSWTEIDGENGYEISRSTSKTGTDNKTTTTKNYINLEPKQNKTYYYKVRAYRGSSNNRVYTPWSEVTSYDLRYVSEVRNVEAKLSGGYDDVEVTWKKSKEGANKYFVYMKKGNGSYTQKGSTSETSYKVKDLADGVKYTFKVVPAYVKNGKTIVTGTYKTASVQTLNKMNAPTFERTNKYYVKVKWKKVEGASGYEISKTTIDSNTSVVATVYSGSITSKSIKAKKGLTAFIKVRPYKKVGMKKIYGPWSNATEIHYSK